MATDDHGKVPLHGELVVLVPATVDDAPRVLDVLVQPDVARWWPDQTLERVRETIESGDEHSFVVELDGRAVGVIQYWEETDPEYRHAGIDVALHPDVQERGLGTDAVRTMAQHLARDRGHHRLTIDPAATNARAIRCYEKVGFRPVGVMRDYERGADGTWHDGLLMDLLAEDLLAEDLLADERVADG
jgi:aminoglycoside 6'-N-acetyltransferase